jgi:hypothetical protein
MRLDHVRGAVEQAREMRRDSPLGVFQGCTVALPDDREELMDHVVRVDRDNPTPEVLKRAWFFGE